MGRLSAGFFGLPSGKAGNITFFIRNGKPYFYITAREPRVIKSSKIKVQNIKFRYCTSFCSAVYNIKALRSIWEEYGFEKMNTFNKIMKFNLKAVKTVFDLSDLLLIPFSEKFSIDIIQLSLDENSLQVTTSAYIGNITGEKRISLQGVLQITEPADENLRAVRFFSLHSKDQDLTGGIPLTFRVNLDAYITECLKNYSKRKLLLNLAVKDTESLQGDFFKHF
jgi:hypothetical protein